VPAGEASLLEQAPAAARSAGCGDVVVTGEYPGGLDRFHIGSAEVPVSPPLASYPSTPPASGPHAPVPWPSGSYADPPDVYRTIHSLEHAAAIIWYAPQVASDPVQAGELANLRAFFSRPGRQEKVIIAPFAYPAQGAAGRLQEGARMSLVAWHRMRSCERTSLAVAFAFVDQYRFDPAAPERYRGVAPEPGVPIE
jgi:hypothetical protein